MSKNVLIVYILLFLGYILFSGLIIGCQSQAPSVPSATTTASSGPTASAPIDFVDISGFAFNPSTITILKDTTITWNNNDGVAHTVTSTSGPVAFDSGTFSTGGTFSFKFSSVGTYEYHCSIHPSMTGTIVVR